MKSSEALRIFVVNAEEDGALNFVIGAAHHYIEMVFNGEYPETFDHGMTAICLAAAIAESEGY